MALCLQVDTWRSDSSAVGRAVLEGISAIEAPCRAFDDPQLPFSAAQNSADAIYSALLSLWETSVDGEFVFPAPRMTQLLQLIGKMLVSFCQRSLLSTDVPFWQQPAAKARADLQAVCDLLQLWQGQQLRQLMKDWVPGAESISKHAWQGAPFQDAHVEHFLSRADEIQRLVALQSELKAAVGSEQAAAVDSIFARIRSPKSFQVRCSPPDLTPQSWLQYLSGHHLHLSASASAAGAALPFCRSVLQQLRLGRRPQRSWRPTSHPSMP